MKKMIMAALASLVVICAVAIVISFFMPWAKASTSATRVAKSVKQSIGGTSFGEKFGRYFDVATQAISNMGDINVHTVVSGYDMPDLVHKKSSHVAVALAMVYIKDASNLNTKVLLVYLVPLFALACIALALLGMKNILYVAIMGLVSGIISIVGFFKLMTTDMASAMVQISIEYGLWLTLWAYLAIFVISIVWVAIGRKKA